MPFQFPNGFSHFTNVTFIITAFTAFNSLTDSHIIQELFIG